jgi:dienelactone hydrolase
MAASAGERTQELVIAAGSISLRGTLRTAAEASGIVLFAHGSGSGRHSPRNVHVAEVLRSAGISSLLFDLLTEAEERIDATTAELRFDIPLLTGRLIAATRWLLSQPTAQGGRIGYFGASTGAAAALAAAARIPTIAAVVSRGGRPDLAGPELAQVRAATLLIVGENDREVLVLNRRSLAELRCEAQLAIVPGATHLFEEPGALDEVARLAAVWFTAHLLANCGLRGHGDGQD